MQPRHKTPVRAASGSFSDIEVNMSGRFQLPKSQSRFAKWMQNICSTILRNSRVLCVCTEIEGDMLTQKMLEYNVDYSKSVKAT